MVLGALALAVSVGTAWWVYSTKQGSHLEELTVARGLVKEALYFQPDSTGGLVLTGSGTTGFWVIKDSSQVFGIKSDSASITLSALPGEARIRITQGGDTAYWPYPPSPSP